MALDQTSVQAVAGMDLARLIERHQAGVWRYLRVLGADAATADDLTQETFLAVFQKPFQEFSPSATAAYLRTVARNLFLASKRGQRVVTLPELDELDAAWSQWAGNDGGQELLAALAACLQTLSERSRRALEMRFRDRLTRSAIAAAMGLSEDGAKNLMQRAKQHLRECVERRIA